MVCFVVLCYVLFDPHACCFLFVGVCCFGVCDWLLVTRCVLLGVGCLLIGVHWLLFVLCCWLLVKCFLFVVRCMLRVGRCLFFVVRSSLFACCCLLLFDVSFCRLWLFCA